MNVLRGQVPVTMTPQAAFNLFTLNGTLAACSMMKYQTGPIWLTAVYEQFPEEGKLSRPFPQRRRLLAEPNVQSYDGGRSQRQLHEKWHFELSI